MRHAKHRWLIERDYLELKQELGLGHYEGRGWLGFHHHAALYIAAYGLLVAERAVPLETRNRPAGPGACRSRGPPTQRHSRCGRDATCRTRSPPRKPASPTPSLGSYRDAHAADDHLNQREHGRTGL